MIRLGNGWAVDADDNCFMAGELAIKTKKDKQGNITEYEGIKKPKYYTSIRAAIQGCLGEVQREMVKDTDMTLNDALRRLDEARLSFERVLQDCVKEDMA